MNRKQVRMCVQFLVFIVTAVMFIACKSGGNKAPKIHSINLPMNLEFYEDIRQAEKIFNAIPSPLESAMLIKSAGARFDASLLNPVSNVSRYATNKSMALNLGIYTCNLSFASLYEQTRLIIDYMNAAKRLADGLGILQAIEQRTIDRLEENINNTDVILEIVSETFLNSNAFLEDNGQPAIGAMVLTGGWIEGLYMAVHLVDMNNFVGNQIVSRIVDQKMSIDNLLGLLYNNKENPSVAELIPEIQKLKAVFDKITVTSSPIRPVFDEASNTTLLVSEVVTNITPEIFMELVSTVSEIRNSFIK